MAEPETTIPKGSLVLVTGATGSLATHVIKAFLERGYKVRGTVRDLAKASWLVDDLFKTYADRGDFELAVVRTLADQNAFDEVVKGVSAIAHVASIVTFDSDPNKVIPQTVLGATSILEAALKEPSVREFVYTSSIAAAVMPMLGNSVHVTKDTFNDTAVQLAWAVPTSGGVVYMASKTEAEKAVWRFVEDKKPHFTVNSVGPSSIIGQPLHKSHVDSAGAWLKQLYDGDRVALTSTPASECAFKPCWTAAVQDNMDDANDSKVYTVDVKDAAQLHVAAVVDPEVKNERLQAWASNTNWNGLLAIMRRQYPDRKFIDDLPGLGELSVTSDFTQPLGLLKKWAGQDGWKSLEETVADNMDGILAFSP